MTSSVDWDLLIIPHYLFLQNGQAKDLKVLFMDINLSKDKPQFNFLGTGCLHDNCSPITVHNNCNSKII